MDYKTLMHPDTFARITEMEVDMDDPRQVATACLMFAAFLNEAMGENDEADVVKYLQMISDLGGIALMYMDVMVEAQPLIGDVETIDLSRFNVAPSA